MNNNVIKRGDTLDLEADYSVGDRKLPAATLDVIIQNQLGNTWNLRWPLMEGKATASIVMPKDLPLGKYDVWVAVQPRFLRLYGQVIYSSKKKLKTLEAALIADRGYRENITIKVDGNGFFIVQDWLMYGHPTVAISTGNNEDILHIKPDAWLDSAYTPAAKAYTAFWVTNTDTVIDEKPKVPDIFPVAWGGAGVYKNYSNGELFNSFYSWGGFRNNQEWMIDALSDTTILPETNTKQVVLEKMAQQGINIEQRDGRLFYEGKKLRLFLDEKPTTMSTLNVMAIRHVAIIKLLQPAPIVYADETENGYILAVYNKRYPFVENPQIAQQVFTITGYCHEYMRLEY